MIKQNTVRDAKQLGVAIARIRRLDKITQQELVEKSGVLQKTISAIENGEEGTKIQTLFKVMAALELEFAVQKRRG